MAKHGYNVACDCARCLKERARRSAQSLTNPQHRVPVKACRSASRKPTWGTQEWAETRGDDLGESNDY